jgi:hypothetical protein
MGIKAVKAADKQLLPAARGRRDEEPCQYLPSESFHLPTRADNKFITVSFVSVTGN